MPRRAYHWAVPPFDDELSPRRARLRADLRRSPAIALCALLAASASQGCGDARESLPDVCVAACREATSHAAEAKDQSGEKGPDAGVEPEQDASIEPGQDAGIQPEQDADIQRDDARGMDADVSADADAHIEDTSVPAVFAANDAQVDQTDASVADASDALDAADTGSAPADASPASDASEDATSSADADARAPEPAADSGVECCPPSAAPGCCMAFGGAKLSENACGYVCDGMPMPSDPAWRLVTDAHGCPRWTARGVLHYACCDALRLDAGAPVFACFEPPWPFDAGL